MSKLGKPELSAPAEFLIALVDPTIDSFIPLGFSPFLVAGNLGSGVEMFASARSVQTGA
jgi:hypothetical protein